MINIGPDGCDARDTAPEEPDLIWDQFVAAESDGDYVRVDVMDSDGHEFGFTFTRPDAQLLARSIYDALEGFDRDAG